MEVHEYPSKVNHILKAGQCTNRAKLRSLAGFCEYNRRFIPGFADLSTTLFKKISARVTWKWKYNM